MDAVDSWQDGQDDDEADDMLTGAMPSSLLQPQLPLDGENTGGAGSTANSRSVTPRGGEEHAPLLNLPELSAEGDVGASLPPPSEPPDDRSSGGAPSVRRDWLLEGLSATATPRAGAAEQASASEETEAPEALRAQVRCLREEIRHMEAAAEREQVRVRVRVRVKVRASVRVRVRVKVRARVSVSVRVRVRVRVS